MKPTGLTKLPLDKWDEDQFTGTLTSINPRTVDDVYRRATGTGMHLVLAIPRSLVTNTGEQTGYFVLTRAKASIDGIRKSLTDAEWSKFKPLIHAIMLIDEPVAPSWDRPADADAIADYVRYAQERLPGIDMLIRIPPSADWVQTYHGWPPGIVGYAQWHLKRGPRKITNPLQRQQAYYASEKAAADDLDWGLCCGVNVRDFEGANTNVWATPDQIRTHVGEATKTPWNCFSTHWWYEPAMTRNNALMTAWKDVVDMGRHLDNVDCGPQ